LTNEVILWYDYSIEEVITMNNIYVLLVVVGFSAFVFSAYKAKEFYRERKTEGFIIATMVALFSFLLAIDSFLKIARIVDPSL